MEGEMKNKLTDNEKRHKRQCKEFFMIDLIIQIIGDINKMLPYGEVGKENLDEINYRLMLLNLKGIEVLCSNIKDLKKYCVEKFNEMEQRISHLEDDRKEGTQSPVRPVPGTKITKQSSVLSSV